MTAAAILFFGPPACGKSTLARGLVEAYRGLSLDLPMLYLSTDDLRESVSGDVYLTSARAVVHDGVSAMTVSALRSDHHVVVDGNYLDPALRGPLLERLTETGVRVLKVLVSCDVDQAALRNRARPPHRQVPDAALRARFLEVASASAVADLHWDTTDHIALSRIDEVLSWLRLERC